MAVFINEPAAFDLLVQMEGDDYADPSWHHAGSNQSFQVVKAYWEECQELLAEMDDWGPEEIGRFNERVLPDKYVIYGLGGWHRYIVLGSGEIRFSRFHAREENIQRAKELGFTLC